MRKRKKYLGKTGVIDQMLNKDGFILGFTKKRGHIVYGARSLQAQNHLFGRDTQDWDILSSTPKKCARDLKNLLNEKTTSNHYYKKPAKHKGTFKVRTKGNDGIKGTDDDEDIADFSKKEGKIPYIKKDGVKYRSLAEEIKAKKKSVADPEFKFRHKKDKDDLNRVKGFLRVKRILRGLEF
jgi:hypothetical protein